MSAATTENMIEVHVKTMTGDVITLEIEPTENGVDSISYALSQYDPTYSVPHHIFPLEEKDDLHTPYHGMMFGVFVYPSPHCTDIQSYDNVDYFSFEVRGKILHFYVTVTEDHEILFKFSPEFIPFDIVLGFPGSILLHPTGFHTTLYEAISGVSNQFTSNQTYHNYFHTSYRDSVIQPILEFIHTHRDPDAFVSTPPNEPLWCSCGQKIARRCMKRHLKSKKHHDYIATQYSQ